MAEKKGISKSNLTTIILIVVAFVVLGGIIAYAWNTKPATTATSSSSSGSSTASAADVDKLGPKEVKLTPSNFDSVINGNKVVLVDVYSPTCPHCVKIAPILTEISNDNAGKVVVAKMSTADTANIDFITKKFTDFQYVPAIWIYKDGKVVENFTGERTKQEFQDLLNKYL